MSNQIFNFNSNPVRVELFENQPHFCLLDVCSIFEIKNSRRVQSQMLDLQGVRYAYILAKDEKQRKTAFINEPNLYRIIFRSEKPIAKEFQSWVFEEVLPQIRKTGKYQLEPKQIALPEPETTYSATFTEKELHILSIVLDKYVPMITTFCNNVETQQRNVYKALGLPPMQNNPLAARAYSINHEFRYWLDEAKEIIKRIKPSKNYALDNV